MGVDFVPLVVPIHRQFTGYRRKKRQVFRCGQLVYNISIVLSNSVR
jgi:hypothetical protein